MPVKSIKYQHVIWDWNGTLLNDMWLCVEVVNQLLEQHKKPLITSEDYHKHFDFPVQYYYEKIGFNFKTDSSFEELSRFFIDGYMAKVHTCHLQETTIDTLDVIHKQNINQYILSAASQKGLLAMTTTFKVKDYFKAIAGRQDEYAVSKIDHGQTLMKEYNIVPEQAIMIGDTCHDYEVANALGIDCLLINRGHHPEERLNKCKSLAVINNISEVLPYINPS